MIANLREELWELGRWFSPARRGRYRILDLGVAAVVSLQFQGLPVPVGDEAVIGRLQASGYRLERLCRLLCWRNNWPAW